MSEKAPEPAPAAEPAKAAEGATTSTAEPEPDSAAPPEGSRPLPTETLRSPPPPKPAAPKNSPLATPKPGKFLWFDRSEKGLFRPLAEKPSAAAGKKVKSEVPKVNAFARDTDKQTITEDAPKAAKGFFDRMLGIK